MPSKRPLPLVMTGRVIGHYRVLEKIGAGAMGEVYRARDERLQRDVAIKLIKPSSSSNPDHVRRFEQEARAAAGLNHPNIVAIYDVGTDDGSPYIVSELLEGKTLRRLLAEGPIPVGRAADYALQIVQGLIVAHDRRIVHRDLKPENLFVTNDGRVKILDFGVAKLQPTSDGTESIEQMTTVTKSGAVIGTVAYMSPEQLRARPVDHRSDIFAVGAVLYEMLAGRRAFRGETEVDTMTAVLREDPLPVDPEQSGIPASFQQIVRHCLEKDPENRFQSARDLAFSLGTLAGAPGGLVLTPPSRISRSAKILPWALAAIAGVFAFLFWLMGQYGAESASYRRLTFEEGTVYSARFAPDGRSIVYGAAWNGKPLQLFSTVGESLQVQPLDLTGANLLALSRSDELALALGGVRMGHLETENGVLATAPLAGGSPRQVLEDVPWADWDENGKLAVVHNVKSHYQIEYPIGHVLYESKGWISHLRFSPASDKIAFVDHPALWDDRGSVYVMSLNGDAKALSPGWESVLGLAWSPIGNEIWFTAAHNGSDRGLFAVNLSGKLRAVLHLPGGLTLEDIARDGRVLLTFNAARLAMAASIRGSSNVVDLSWHDWTIAKDISRDGQWILFEDASEAAGPNYTVNLRKMDGSLPLRLGEGSAGGLSPDGKWVISVSTKNSEVTLLPIGPGQPRTIAVPGLERLQNGSARFLADGRRFVVNGNEAGHETRCFLVNINGGTPKPITPEGVVGGRVSPDGRYIYELNPAAQVTLYPLENGDPRTIPGLEATFRPAQWSDDSSAIYGYLAGEVPAKVYKVDTATGRKILIQTLAPVFPAGVVGMAPVIISHDATRFAYSYSQVRSELYLVSGLH